MPSAEKRFRQSDCALDSRGGGDRAEIALDQRNLLRMMANNQSNFPKRKRMGVPPRCQQMEVSMTDDMTIQKRVIDELEWSVLVDATHIGVAVRQGIVELTGHVETYAEKLKAERVALGVKGVKGVAQEITVRSRRTIK